MQELAERYRSWQTSGGIHGFPGRTYTVGTGRIMNFSGIDLRCTADHEWYCFEVNPSPGFTYFEIYTGQARGKEVTKFLN